MTSIRERNMRLATRGGANANTKSMFDARPLFGQADPAVEYPLLAQSYPPCGNPNETSIPNIRAIARTPSIPGYPNPLTPLHGSPGTGLREIPDLPVPEMMPVVVLRGYPATTSVGPRPQAPPSEAMLQAYLPPEKIQFGDFRSLQTLRRAAHDLLQQQPRLKAAGQVDATSSPTTAPQVPGTGAPAPGTRANAWLVAEDGAQVLLELGVSCATWSSWTEDRKRAGVTMLSSSHRATPAETEATIVDRMAVADNYCAWAGQYHGTVTPEFLPSPPPTPGSQQEIDTRVSTIMQIMRMSCNDWQAMTDEQRKAAVTAIAPTLSGTAGVSPEAQSLIVDQNVALISDYCVRHPNLVKPWMVWTAAGVAAAGVIGWLVWAETQNASKREKPRASSSREHARVSGVRPIVRESGRPMRSLFGTG